MNFNELLSHKESLYSQLDRVWNFYIVVLLAVVGWLLSKTTLHVLQAVGFTVCLPLFFYSNYWGSQSVLRRLEVSLREMLALVDSGKVQLASVEFQTQLREELKDIVARKKLTKFIHLTIGLAVIIVIWKFPQLTY
jgi:hypothetical protein